jgi:hypothetical protein
MYINFKGQVEVKVRKGKAEVDGDRMMANLAEEVERTIRQFLRDNSQTEEAYTWVVSSGKSPMKV